MSAVVLAGGVGGGREGLDASFGDCDVELFRTFVARIKPFVDCDVGDVGDTKEGLFARSLGFGGSSGLINFGNRPDDFERAFLCGEVLGEVLGDFDVEFVEDRSRRRCSRGEEIGPSLVD